MSRIAAVQAENASAKVKHLYDGVEKKLGLVPNLMKVLGNSEAALQAYLGFSGALGAGVLDAKIREEIAILTAQTNGCDYCLSAHTLLGKGAGLTVQETKDARVGKGLDARSTAALTFATEVLKQKGEITDAQLQAVRAAGFSEGEITEIVAQVALNVFTNYFNIAAETDIDFPKVSSKELAA